MKRIQLIKDGNLLYVITDDGVSMYEVYTQEQPISFKASDFINSALSDDEYYSGE